jgi:hypothetical protein
LKSNFVSGRKKTGPREGKRVEEGNSSIKEAQLGCISCEDASNVVVLGDSDANDDDDDDGDVAEAIQLSLVDAAGKRTKNQTTPPVRRSGISMTMEAERVEVMTMSSI